MTSQPDGTGSMNSNVAVVLGVIQEQMAELNRKIDHLVTNEAAKDERLRNAENKITTLETLVQGFLNKKPSQFPQWASAVSALVLGTITVVTLLVH